MCLCALGGPRGRLGFWLAPVLSVGCVGEGGRLVVLCAVFLERWLRGEEPVPDVPRAFVLWWSE